MRKEVIDKFYVIRDGERVRVKKTGRALLKYYGFLFEVVVCSDVGRVWAWVIDPSTRRAVPQVLGLVRHAAKDLSPFLVEPAIRLACARAIRHLVRIKHAQTMRRMRKETDWSEKLAARHLTDLEQAVIEVVANYTPPANQVPAGVPALSPQPVLS